MSSEYLFFARKNTGINHLFIEKCMILVGEYSDLFSIMILFYRKIRIIIMSFNSFVG